MKKQTGELLSEIIKRKIPTSIEQKLHSYQKTECNGVILWSSYKPRALRVEAFKL